MIAGTVAAALAAQGGAGNPAVANLADFTMSLMYAQGGLSPLEIGTNPGEVPSLTNSGLFEIIRGSSYVPSANPEVSVTAPMSLGVTFTNAGNNGWGSDAVGSSTQKAYPELSSDRVDPFLPLFMIWNVQLNPLLLETKDANGNPAYSPGNLTDFFALDSDSIDYEYVMDKAVSFTSPSPVTYSNSALIGSNSAGVLIHQINKYLNNYPSDPDSADLQEVVTEIGNQQFFSQAIGTFNAQQILTSHIAQVPVEDLTEWGGRDPVTSSINSAIAASASSGDDWYKYGFNSIEPIATGLLAENNFGPLRSGFLEVQGMEIVDVFGQRMQFSLSQEATSLTCVPSYSLAPDSNDTANASKVFLPPRLLTPTRLWFRWISALNSQEINPSPDTSPICGWIMPNHLDNSLFFYDADGRAIGSFGIDSRGLTYSTRAGNISNPNNSLSTDIGPQGAPTVNPSIANFMWYLSGQNSQFFSDLMASIQNSGQFLNPANFAESVSLSVLLGSALALTRVALGMETQGNLLPISQADTNVSSPFPYAVTNNQYKYHDRMQSGSANLGSVQFPVRLGDLTNMDDGLIGYLIEDTGSNPYTGATFYSPAATPQMDSGVVLPQPTTVQLTLNTEPIILTLLIDPRVAIHATTGILPVSQLKIPKNQYAKAMRSLAVSFISRPMLKMQQ